jgi:acetyltransferase-like isoleucine patch superfamily enzyme
MPDLTIGEGAVCGTFSFVTKDIMPWTINTGIPAKPIKKRNKDVLKYYSEILKND